MKKYYMTKKRKQKIKNIVAFAILIVPWLLLYVQIIKLIDKYAVRLNNKNAR